MKKLTNKQRRDLVRAAHLLLAVPLGAIAYGPPEYALTLRTTLQLVIFPALVLTGLWMWQGARLKRWVSGGGADRAKLTRHIANREAPRI